LISNTKASEQTEQQTKKKSAMQPRLICSKCKDPADPMLRIKRQGLLKLIPTAKRFLCTRCGRERTRLFGINF
jgi:hypothetical protein